MPSHDSYQGRRMDDPSPSPSTDYQVPTISIPFGHYLWPLFWAGVMFIACIGLIYLAYRAATDYDSQGWKPSSGNRSEWAYGVGAVGAAAISYWQFTTFWHRATVAARPIGLGSLALVVVVGAILIFMYAASD